MIAIFVGVFVFLAGAAITANAAFSNRATLGIVIALVGGIIFSGGMFEIIVSQLMTDGVSK